MPMIKSPFKVLSTLFLLIWLHACDISGDEFSYRFVTLPVTEVAMPESFDLGQTYEIDVTVLLPNGCTQFEGFDVISEGRTIRRVVPIGTEQDGVACTQEVSEVESSFRFTCIYTQTYVFRFWTGEGENGQGSYLEMEIPVNP